MAKKTAVDTESATTQVNIADFQRTRDSVIVALATLQSSVQELSRAYINHANTVLAPGRGGALDSNLTNILTESGLLTGVPQQPLPNVEEPSTSEKKKRKRVPHDPNAPKRALTPYFLFMQSARAQIAKELGESAKPKEVADEGTRRWSEMSPAEKSIWDDKYQMNLAAYRVRMAAYKAGQPVPDDDEAARLVEAGKAPDHVPGVDLEVEEEEEVESAEETPEPVKEPEPPKSKRRKSDKKVVETPKETPKSEKKTKKTTAAKKEASPVPTSTSKAAPKGKKTRKG